MVELIDALVDHISAMYRMGYIDSNAYLDLHGRVMAIKQVYKASDISAALALYEAVKAVINA